MTREEAIKIVRNIYQTDAEKEALATLIPELAESEDERIIKTLQDYVKNRNWPLNGPTQDEVLAYLERQKKQKPSIFPPGLGEVRWNPISLSSVKQKPASTAKSKFKSGDSIRFNGFGSNEYTIQLVGNGYYVNSEGGRMDMSYTDANFVLIEEPKPVEWEWPNLSNCIKNCKKCRGKCFYRKEPYEEQKPAEKLSKEEYVKKFKALCDAYEIKLPNREYDIYGLCEDLHKLFGDIQKPAECEDCAMYLSGNCIHPNGKCENVKSKPEWGEEDQKSLNRAINICISDFGEDCETARFLKSLPERFNLQSKQEWSEEDEKMRENIISDLRYFRDCETDEEAVSDYDDEIAWLKDISLNHKKFTEAVYKLWSNDWSDEDKEALDMCLDAIPKRWKTKSGILLTKWLKDNIHLQLKQEWSDEDKEMLECVIMHVESAKKNYLKSTTEVVRQGAIIADKELAWLKALRPSWKPSKEQMEALRKLMKYAVSLSSYYDIQKEIESLYNDLNKLK